MLDGAELYGLHVRSEVPLHQARAPRPGTPVDLLVRLGPTRGEVPLSGHVLLDGRGERALYTAVRQDDGTVVLRVHGLCDFVLEAGLTEVTVHPTEGTGTTMIGVLVTGTLLSFVLALRGHPVLHASAVEIGDQAVAFVGASGMGKSTSATLLCAAGGRLVTDDVLRLDPGAPPRCRLGATELRLRKASADLSALFTAPPAVRVTGDAREALAPEPATRDHLPLAALVIPVPDRAGGGSVELHRLSGPDPVLMLTRFPRLLGWRDPVVVERQFREVADITTHVPVYVACLPWGPPFPADLGAGLLDSLGLGATATTHR